MALELRLFGGLDLIDASGRPIEVSAKKARALLAFLAAEPGRRHAREHVAALLWGDISADEHARRSLRQALSVLRKLVPDGVLDSGRDELGVAESAVRADVAEFRAAIARGDRESLRHGVALYRGDFLEGFSARADGFDDWAGRERARLREQAIEAMERLGRFERDAGRLDAAITLAMRVVALEPLRESAHRELMQLYVAADMPGRALRQYDTCRKILARELSIAPSQATAAVAARIRATDAGDVATPRSSSEPSEPSDRTPAPPGTPGGARGPSLRHVVVVHVAVAWDDVPNGSEARQAVRDALARSGGRVFRDTPDALAAVYGASRTRGDALEQATNAALSLRARLTEARLAVRIGLASGQALVDEQGPGIFVQGEVVSLASSLHEVGSLVVSGSVRAGLGERAEVRERARVRGVVAWELVALRPEDVAPWVLVGREFELSQLVASLSPCVATGRGRSYLVRGEPGIGKTTLVASFCREAQRAGFDVRRYPVLDFGCGTETELLQALTRDLLVDAPTDDPAAALSRAALRGELDASDLGFAMQMVAPSSHVGQLDAGADETTRRRDEIAGKLLRARSRRRPQLIWIEDIHWARPSALRQLQGLVSAVAECRALLIMTTRLVGEPDDAEWRRAVRGRAVSTLDLAPLDEPAARQLLEWLQQRRGNALDDAARLIERAGGNPLFLEQLSWADAPDVVPGSVQALVQTRMDALDASSRYQLQAASVLGQELEDAALARLLGAEVDIAELIEHGFLRDDAHGSAFAHALVRDAVYASVPDDRRRTLHLAAAAYYEDRDPLLRAGHLERARDQAAACAYARAADEERVQGRMERALELCDRAASLATSDADVHRLGLLRGELLREVGKAEDALASFGAALRHGSSPEERARALLGAASALRLRDRQEQALAALDEAEAILDAQASPELASHVCFMRGNVLFPSGDAEACLREHQRALELARAARSPLAEAQAKSGMADAHYVAGRMRSAATLFEQCETIAEREGFTHLERTSRGMRLVIQVMFLRVREAAARCAEEADRAEGAGALRAVAVLRTGACLALGYLGDWERMETLAQSAASLTRRMGARRFEALALAYLATARFHLGKSHASERARALELSQSSGLAFSGGIVHATLVTTASEPDSLRVELRRGLAALDAGAVAHGRVVFLTSAISAALRLRDAELARRLADELSRTNEEPCELPTLFVDLGRAAADVLAAPGSSKARSWLAEVAERAAAAGLRPVADLVARI